jgi:hypothetical protein
MADRDVAGPGGYGDWRSLELAIKDAARKTSAQAGPGVTRPVSMRRSGRPAMTGSCPVSSLRASGLSGCSRAG